jgi:hypothetical protein
VTRSGERDGLGHAELWADAKERTGAVEVIPAAVRYVQKATRRSKVVIAV